MRLVALVALLIACGDDAAIDPDAAALMVDAAILPDAEPQVPLAGFGTITGDCGVLDDELTEAAPSHARGAIEFAREYTAADLSMLTSGGQQIVNDGTLGGSSVLSEAFAFELLSRCELAMLLKTEGEIVYDTEGKKTDFVADIDGNKIGVSVTRAVGFPRDDPYTVTQARSLLEDKLADIIESSANVSAADRWHKQILAIMAYAPGHADSLITALGQIDGVTKADTIVWITVTNGSDDFIYCDGPCT